jgi:hypothetical protein
MQDEEAVPSLTREAADAAWGLAGLVRGRPDWGLGFDPTARGFVRSFLAPALALPFYLLTAAMIARTSSPESGSGALWAAGLSDVLDALAYPLVVAAFARPLGIGAGFSAFVVVINWASLFLNPLLALFSFALLFGRVGSAVFGTATLVLFALSIFVTWRAARETLSPELAPALLMVVLSVGVGVLCDQAGADLVRLFSL